MTTTTYFSWNYQLTAASRAIIPLDVIQKETPEMHQLITQKLNEHAKIKKFDAISKIKLNDFYNIVKAVDISLVCFDRDKIGVSNTYDQYDAQEQIASN
jgi:hypothetical protein